MEPSAVTISACIFDLPTYVESEPHDQGRNAPGVAADLEIFDDWTSWITPQASYYCQTCECALVTEKKKFFDTAI